MKTPLDMTPKINLFVKWLALLLTLSLGFSPALAADQVPLKGNGQGAIVGATPVPAGLALSVVAAGQATHLGNFSRVENLLFNPTAGTLAGTIVFTAANGDQLAGIVSGSFIAQTTAAGAYTFTGGTGRFQNAAGSASFVVSTSDGVHFTVEFQGTLSSVGANQK